MKKFTLFMGLLAVIIGLQARAADIYVETSNPTFNVYTWNPEDFGGWPGKGITEIATLTDVNGKQYYKFSLDGTERNIIFNKDGKQTETISVLDGDNYFTYPINDDFSSYETTNPPVAITCYTIAGDGDLVGSNWNTSDETNDMTLQDDGTYQLVKENLTLSAGGYEYKVVGNHKWGLWEVPGSGNQILTIAEDGKYNVTFTLTLGENAASSTLVADAVKVEDVVVTHTYTIAGDENLVGSNWNTSDETNDMTLQDDGTYKLVKENIELDAKNYEYKVVRDHDWSWSVPAGSGNQTLTIAEAGKYNVTFTLTLGNEAKLEAVAELISKNEPKYLLHYGIPNEEWADAEFVAVENEEGKFVAQDVEFAQDTQFGVKCGEIWYAGRPNEGDDFYWIHDTWCVNIPLNTGEGVKNFIINEAGIYTFTLTVTDEGITMDVEGFPAAPIVGDLSNNGTVDVEDVNIMINMILGKLEKTAAADLNGDGDVDVADVDALVNIVLGKGNVTAEQ